jgi:D-methionine transport system permease protein
MFENSLLLWKAFQETCFMSFSAAVVAIGIGLPLGLLLAAPKKTVGMWISHIILNILRAIPFIILMIVLFPFTRFLIGTTLGWKAAMVPLSIAAIPLYARLSEQAFRALPFGLFEAGLSMGASPWSIYRYIWIPEARSSLIRAATTLLIAIVSFSAMAGVVGGGGLGALAYHYGFQRFDATLLWGSVILLIVLIEAVQLLGNYIVFISRCEHGEAGASSPQ